MNVIALDGKLRPQKRPWTTKEVVQLKSLANQGTSSGLIAKLLSRSLQSVKQKAFLVISLASRA